MPNEKPEKPIEQQSMDELIVTAANLKLEYLKIVQKSDAVMAELIRRMKSPSGKP